jgi:hypothetical protein
VLRARLELKATKVISVQLEPQELKVTRATKVISVLRATGAKATKVISAQLELKAIKVM